MQPGAVVHAVTHGVAEHRTEHASDQGTEFVAIAAAGGNTVIVDKDCASLVLIMLGLLVFLRS